MAKADNNGNLCVNVRSGGGSPSGGKAAIFPDTSVIMDNWFDDGFNGWEEYSIPLPFTTTTNMLPIVLGTDGNFGRYSLRLTTANVKSGSHAGQAYAMKRMTHQSQPN